MLQRELDGEDLNLPGAAVPLEVPPPNAWFQAQCTVQEMAGKIADWASQSQLIVFDSYHVTSELLEAMSEVCPDAIIILFEDHQVPALLTSNPATS